MLNEYVLKRCEDGKYVAKSGNEHSYTRKLEDAEIFRSKESAMNAACGNEYPVSLAALFDRR